MSHSEYFVYNGHNTDTSRRKVRVWDVREAARNNQKISLIKLYRQLTGLGLKDAKDAIEEAGSREEDIMYAFEKVCAPLTISKDEFIQIISEAIDNMDKFYHKDMLHAVQVLCENIKDYGGLQRIAMERDSFLNGI